MGMHPSLDEYTQFAVRSEEIRALCTLKISQLKFHSRTKSHIENKLLGMQSKLSRTGTVKTKEKRVQLKIGQGNRARRYQKEVSIASFFKLIFEAKFT